MYFPMMAGPIYSFNHELPADYPSLNISRVFANISRERIIRCFEILLGADNCIERIDRIIQKGQDGDDFWRVYIHFKSWPNTSAACELRARVINGEMCKIVYDDPWWWNVTESKAPKPRYQDGKRPAPYLVPATPSPPPPPPPALQRQVAIDSRWQQQNYDFTDPGSQPLFPAVGSSSYNGMSYPHPDATNDPMNIDSDNYENYSTTNSANTYSSVNSIFSPRPVNIKNSSNQQNFGNTPEFLPSLPGRAQSR